MRFFNSICFSGWLVAALVTLAGCATSTPPPTATATPFPPTFTPTPTASATAPPSPTPSSTAAALQSVATNTPTLSATPRLRLSDQLPTRTPTATPLPGLACLVGPGDLNLREGPGAGYRILAVLPGGVSVMAQKRAPGDGWLLVSTGQNSPGWVYAPLVNCPSALNGLPIAQGVVVHTPIPAVAAVTPTNTPVDATPSATPLPEIPIGRWRGDYYDNASLLGEPVLVRQDETIDFNWFLDSPGPGIPADNFSVRWTGRFNFTEAGDYRFYANVDDGMRLYVDGWRIIDAWNQVLPVDYWGDFEEVQPGLHTITVEYFESGGHARARVWSERGNFVDDKWQGDYYANRDLSGSPRFSRSSDDIDFDWGRDSPDRDLSNNDFSVRWRKTVNLEYGDYKFYADVEEDDYIKVTVDDWTIFEEYADDDTRLENSFSRLGGDNHTIEVIYQEHGGKAKIKFWWDRQ